MSTPSKTITVTDPQYTPKARHNAFDRWALRLLKDERDLPFMYLMAAMTVTIVPAAIVLFVPGLFAWWLAAGYWVLVFAGFLDRFILMLHNTSHRQLFKREYRRLNVLIPWVYGPFFGETPETYFAHHIGMHHPENNLDDDLSSTMRYRRDSLPGFLHYFFKFFLFGFFELSRYHYTRGRSKFFRRTLAGELSYYALTVVLLFVNWQAALTVFVVPLFLTRFLMMAGNWGQHAFIDARDPANCYVNSITCINTRYNHRAWNDGYHIGHHIKPNRHWTEMPGDFLETIDEYAKNDALVFEGIDYFGIWLLLMTGRHDALAKKVVQLPGRPERTHDELVALLHERLAPIRRTAEQGSELPAAA
jgi:hypothetical protein